MKIFRVSQIDHVELFVPDRYEAARWYQRILGLKIIPEYEHWGRNPNGPLMISTQDAATKLALFEGEAQGPSDTAGFRRVAFRVDGPAFLEFLSLIEEFELQYRGRKLTARDFVDHAGAFSVYFDDPWGRHYEVTTHDVEPLKTALAEPAAGLNLQPHQK